MTTKSKFTILLFISTALWASSFFVGCSGKPLDESNPQELYKEAEEDIKDKKFVAALDKLKIVKNKYPYSHLATQSKLRIADVYYEQESYIEAAGSYESFRDLHPKHEKADYVLFRIGESHFNQLPGGEDRDLTPASKAIESYRELITLYPNSTYITEAKRHLLESTEQLAKKEQYIADFYYIRKMFDSAAGRYEKITTQYPATKAEERAYSRWAQSLIKQEKLDEAKHVYRTYISRYPTGSYANEAGNWLDSHGGR